MADYVDGTSADSLARLRKNLGAVSDKKPVRYLASGTPILTPEDRESGKYTPDEITSIDEENRLLDKLGARQDFRAEPNVVKDVVGGVVDAGKRGLKNMSTSLKLAEGQLISDEYGMATTLHESAKYKQENPSRPEGTEMMGAFTEGFESSGKEGLLNIPYNAGAGIMGALGEVSNDWKTAKGVGDKIGSVRKNLSGVAEGLAEQIPNMFVPMILGGSGMAVGGAMGTEVPVFGNVTLGAVGAWSGFTLGNTAVELEGMALEALEKAGVDLNNIEAVASFLEKNKGDLLLKSAKKGATIALVDVVTLGVGGKILSAPVKGATARSLTKMGVDVANKGVVAKAVKSGKFYDLMRADKIMLKSTKGVRNVARNTAVASLDPLSEFLGEYVGTGWATGEWKTKDAFIEALVSMGHSGITFAGQKIYAKAKSPISKAKQVKFIDALNGTVSGSDLTELSDESLNNLIDRSSALNELHPKNKELISTIVSLQQESVDRGYGNTPIAEIAGAFNPDGSKADSILPEDNSGRFDPANGAMSRSANLAMDANLGVQVSGFATDETGTVQPKDVEKSIPLTEVEVEAYDIISKLNSGDVSPALAQEIELRLAEDDNLTRAVQKAVNRPDLAPKTVDGALSNVALQTDPTLAVEETEDVGVTEKSATLQAENAGLHNSVMNKLKANKSDLTKEELEYRDNYLEAKDNETAEREDQKKRNESFLARQKESEDFDTAMEADAKTAENEADLVDQRTAAEKALAKSEPSPPAKDLTALVARAGADSGKLAKLVNGVSTVEELAEIEGMIVAEQNANPELKKKSARRKLKKAIREKREEIRLAGKNNNKGEQLGEQETEKTTAKETAKGEQINNQATEGGDQASPSGFDGYVADNNLTPSAGMKQLAQKQWEAGNIEGAKVLLTPNRDSKGVKGGGRTVTVEEKAEGGAVAKEITNVLPSGDSVRFEGKVTPDGLYGFTPFGGNWEGNESTVYFKTMEEAKKSLADVILKKKSEYSGKKVESVDKATSDFITQVGKVVKTTSKTMAVVAVLRARAKSMGMTLGAYIKSRGIEVRTDDKAGKFTKKQRRENKGATFVEDGKTIIQAFESADISTFLHELGHIFRKDLSPSEMKIANKFVGAKDGAKWTVHQEEKFARGWETYLMEGVASNKDLAKIFENMKQWLLAIYKEVSSGSGVGIKLTPEIIQLFDTLTNVNPTNETKSATKQTQEPLFQKGDDVSGFGTYYADKSIILQTKVGGVPLGDQGVFDPVGGDILFQADTKEFKEWSGGADVIDGYDISEAKADTPAVFNVYHGTTHAFSVFDPTKTGNKGGAFGAVNYFTSDMGDADLNYAGEGADLTNRLEERADQLYDDLYSMTPEEATEAFGRRVYEDTDIQALSMFIAKEELSGDNAHTKDVFVRLDKPAYVNGDTQTWIQNSERESYREDAIQSVKEENGATDEQIEDDEFYDEIEQYIDESSMHDEPKILVALQEALNEFETDANASEIYSSLEIYDDQVLASELETALRDSEELAYAQDFDSPNGELVSSHIVGQVFKNLGYDGIVLQNADKRFQNMDMGSKTAHVHVFEETPSNIKSATDNSGAFSRDNPDILFQRAKKSVQKTRNGIVDHKKAESGDQIIKAILGRLKKISVGDNVSVIHTGKFNTLIKGYNTLISKTQDSRLSLKEKQELLGKYLMVFPPEVAKKGIPRLKNLGNYVAKETQQKHLDKAIEFVERKFVEFETREIKKAIRKMIKPNQIKAGQLKKGKMTAQTVDDIAYINSKVIVAGKDDTNVKRSIVDLTADQADEVVEALNSRLDKLLEKDDEITTKSQNIQDRHERRKLNITNKINLVGHYAMKGMTLDDLKRVQEDLHNLINNGRMSWKELEERRLTKNKELRQLAYEGISGDKNPTLETAQQRQERRKKEAGTIGKILMGLSHFDNIHQSWETQIDKLERKTGVKMFKGRLTEYFTRLAHSATRTEEALNIVDNNMMLEAQQRIFGVKSKRKIGKILSEMGDEKNSVTIPLYSDSVQYDSITLSQSELAYFYSLSRDKSLISTFTTNGYSPKSLALISEKLDPRLKVYTEWLSDTLGDKKWADINPVYKEMFGSNMTNTEHYTPVVRDYMKGDETDTMLQQAESHASTIVSSMKTRSQTKLAFKPQNLFDVWEGHRRDINHFTAWGIPVREMRGVFSHPQTRALIEQHHGTVTKTDIDNTIDAFAQGDRAERQMLGFIEQLRVKFVTAMIGAKPVIFFKQLTSFPAYASDIPADEFAKGLADFMKNPRKAMRILSSSTMMEARYQEGWDRDSAQKLRGSGNKTMKGMEELANHLMYLTKLGDKSAIMFGGWSVYKYHYDKNVQKMGHDKAHKEAIYQFEVATERTQQSRHTKDRGAIQRDKNPFFRGLTSFMTALAGYYRMMSGATRHAKTSKVDSAKRAFIFGVTMNAFFQAVSTLPKAFGDDDDQEDFVKGIGIAVANAPAQGLVIFRHVMPSLINTMAGEKAFDIQFHPATSFVHDATYLAKDTKKAFSGDGDDWLKVLQGTTELGLQMGGGLPVRGVKDWVGGAKRAVEGETDHPYFSMLGYTPYSMNEKKEK